jgi:hypothetical protein
VMRARLALAVVAALVVLSAAPPSGRPAAQQASESVCDLKTTERVVAIGDIHGAYDRFLAILGKAGLADSRGRWTGGRAILVQTGDVLDRGPDSKRVLDLLRRLEQDAPRNGGRVYALLGNHEVMRMVGDWRYVSAAELAAFRTGGSNDVRDAVLQRVMQQAEARAKIEKQPFEETAFRDQFTKEVPLGYIEMRQAFVAQGDYGKWLRSHSTIVKINGVVFMHGGVSADVAALGCDGINQQVRRDITGPPPTPEQLPTMLSSSENGPLWYRGLAEEKEADFLPTFETILKSLGARAIVIGHTPVLQGRIATRFGGRVMLIDTGMLGGEFYPNGVASALEWQGEVVTAIYEDRRERVSTLGTQ